MKEIYLSFKNKQQQQQQQQGEREEERERERDLNSIFNRESLTNEHQ